MSFYHLKEICVALCCLTLAELKNNTHLHATMLTDAFVRLLVGMSCLRDLSLSFVHQCDLNTAA